MNRRELLQAAFLACIMLVSTSNTFAFDGQREGFIIGIGFGPVIDPHKQTVEFSGVEVGGFDAENVFGVVSDFKLGYAPSNLLAIYYNNKVSLFTNDWYDIRGRDYGHYQDALILSGITGVGVSYYFAPDAPAAFLKGGIGFAYSMTTESGSNFAVGYGLFGGAGFEFAQYFSVEGEITYTSTGHTELSAYDFTVQDITGRLTINILGY